MSNKILLKVVGVVAITILLMIPLMMIRGLIRERSRFREQARVDIANSWTGAQNLMGPILRVPYVATAPESTAPVDEPSAEPQMIRGEVFLLPTELTIDADLRTETRKRGLYSVPVYFTSVAIGGTFDSTKLDELVEEGWRIDSEPATLHISLSDNRGIATSPSISWNGEPCEIVPGSGLPMQPGGVRARIDSWTTSEATHSFEIQLELRGMESLSFLPTGEDTRVTLDAEWPHPSFTGRFLPVEYEILDDRFVAEWRVSHLASRVDEVVGAMARDRGVAMETHAFGVSLVNTVDIYQQATRSAKYGSLFIVLTFTAFFLIEFSRRLRLHPMQYLLVGLALSIFFLMLLSLSEHLPFGLAYLLSSLACVGLSGIYLGSAMGRASNGLGVIGILGGLYAMLYAILLSEDNALLMGSLLLFVALAAVMLVTRRLDWYALAIPLPGDRPSPPPTGATRP